MADNDNTKHVPQNEPDKGGTTGIRFGALPSIAKTVIIAGVVVIILAAIWGFKGSPQSGVVQTNLPADNATQQPPNVAPAARRSFGPSPQQRAKWESEFTVGRSDCERQAEIRRRRGLDVRAQFSGEPGNWTCHVDGGITESGRLDE